MASLNPIPVKSTPVTVYFSHPQIRNKLAIRTGANQIEWDYELNTRTTPTYGGEVIQVLSAKIGQLVVSGNTVNEIHLEGIYQWFRQYMEIVTWRKRSQEPAVFEYPNRGWKFSVHIIDAPGMRFATDLVAPEWSITAELINTYDKGILQEVTMKEFRPGYIPGVTGDALPRDIGLVADKYSTSAEKDFIAGNFGDNFQRLLASWLTGDYAMTKSFDQFANPSDNGLNTTSSDIYGGAFNGATGIQLAGGSSTVGGSGTGTSRSFTAISENQNRFCTKLAALTGIDVGTFATVCFAEQGKADRLTSPRHTTVDPRGDYNFLNVEQFDSGVGQGATDQRFVDSPESAAEMTDTWMRTRSAPAIREFLTTMPGNTVEQQLEIWQSSPWATSHYNFQLPSIWQNTIQPTLVEATTSGASGTVGAVIEWARRWIGTPYVWGGNHGISLTEMRSRQPVRSAGRDGRMGYFDCSSLLSWSWANGANVYIGDTTYTQFSAAQQSDRCESGSGRPPSIQAGDLLFWGGNNHHITMAISATEMIESPSTGNDVRIAPISRTDWYGWARWRV